MKTLTKNYPVTFLNGDIGLKERGISHLLDRKEDLEFYAEYGMNEDDETQEILREKNLSFSEIREVLTKADRLSSFFDYGLCFDFVEIGTFDDQDQGYYRYQFSWGGPSEEMRFYYDGKIEFVFLDWFIGVGFDVTGEYFAEWMCEWLKEAQSINWESLDPSVIFPEEYER